MACIGVTGAIVLSIVAACTSDSRLRGSSTEGEPRDIALGNKVIRVLPSALLPPVSNPYLFYWDFGPAPSFLGSVANAQGAGNETQAAEHEKAGRLPVIWTYGPEWPCGKTKEDFIKYYLSVIQPNRAHLVDEWQSARLGVPIGNPLSLFDPFGIRGAIEGIDQAKKRSQGAFILVAWRGEDSLLPLVEKGDVDCLLIEAYSHLSKTQPQFWAIRIPSVDARIAKARSWGIIDRTIPWLGEIRSTDEYVPGHALTAAELEVQIRHYRETAPEMPGVAFYGNSNPDLARAADALCKKYFVDPAPEVAILSPAGGAVLSPTSQIVKAAASPKGGRTVREYRGFIDNRLVYIGSDSVFSWDFSRETRGPHYLTVHAVDDNWNRGAAQVRIGIE